MTPKSLDVACKSLDTTAAAISGLEFITDAYSTLPPDKLAEYLCLLLEYKAATERTSRKGSMAERKQKASHRTKKNKETAVSGTSDGTDEKFNTIKELFAQIKVPTTATPSVETPTRPRKRKRTNKSPASDESLKSSKPSK